jgi:hypothetical protein
MNPHVTQLFAVLLGKGEHQRLALLVDQNEKQFAEAGQQDLWFVWKGQALIGLSKPEEALQIVRQITDPEKASHLESVARRGIALKTGDKKQLTGYLHSLYQRSRDALVLFEWAELMAAEQDWGPVALHAQEIVESIGTAQALRLAAFSLFNAGQPARSLELLTSGIRFFPNTQLPADLRRVRIACQQRLGLTQQAVREAEALASETGQIQDKANLITLKLTSGDPKGANLVAREFLARPDVEPQHLLHLADLVRVEDLSLAQEFLSAAISKGELSPELAPAAVNLAFTVNREDLLPQLFPGLIKVAQSSTGPVKAVSLAEIRQMIEMSGKRRGEIEEMYRRGRVPLHFIIEEFGPSASISSTLHRCLHPEVGPLSKFRPRIYIRHGGRQPNEANPNRLYLDITAILIAAELGILTEIENSYAPIFLPPNINQVLLADLQKSAHPQPRRLENAKLIQALIVGKGINILDPMTSGARNGVAALEGLGDIVANLIQAAREKAGYFTTFLPVTRLGEETPIVLPEEFKDRVIGFGSILSTLVSGGQLSHAEEVFAKEQLRNYLATDPGRDLGLGHPLVLSHGIADCLAGAGVLRATAGCFDVWVAAEEEVAINHEIALENWNESFRIHLRTLIERIRRGLEGRKYQLMPIQAPIQKDIVSLELNPASEASVYLLQAEPTAGAAVWVDDRMLNSHSRYGEIPATDVFEILSGLRTNSCITVEQYCEKLRLLRDSNLRYIPILSEEILFCLKTAKVSHGKIVETPELASLRRAAASHLLDGENLQKPGDEGPNNPMGETLVIIGLYRAACDAVLETWSAVGNAVDEATARADWVLQNLMFNMSWMARLFAPQHVDTQQLELGGMFLAHLYAQGISLPGKRRMEEGDAKAPRELYFRWLLSRFELSTRAHKDVAKHLRRILEADFMIRGGSKLEQKLTFHLLGDFYDDLPASLKSWIHLPQRFLRRMGIRQYYAVETPSCKFDSGTFWRAAARAFQSGRATLTTRETQITFKVRPGKERANILEFVGATPAESFALCDPAFEALSQDPLRRDAALRRQIGWFDKPFAKANAEIGKIATIRDPAERMRQIYCARRKSPAAMDEKLKGLLSRGEKVHLSDMQPPPACMLLQHIRIPAHGSPEDFENVIAAAAEELTKEHGAPEAFRRLSALPIRLPESIFNALLSMAEDEQKAWAATTQQQQPSFIARLHILAALTRCPGGWAGVEAEKLLEWLTSKEAELAYDAFDKVLLWTLYELEEQKEIEATGAGTLLAASWTHACRLYNTLHPFMPDQHMVEFFGRFCDPRMGEVFSPEGDLRGDIAYPRRLRYEALLLHGLTLSNWSAAVSGLAAKAASGALALCFMEHNGAKVPKLELLNDPELHFNSLNSFLGGDRAAVLAALVGTENASFLGSEQIQKETLAAISALAADPKQEAQWIILQALTGPKLPREPIRQKICDLVRRTAFTDLLSLDPKVSRAAMFWLTIQAALLGDMELIKKNREDILAVANRWGSEGSNLTKERDSARADTLLEVIHFATRSGDPPEQNARAFTELLLAVQERWPSVSSEFWAVIKQFAFRIPDSELLEMSPAIMRLRQAAI